MDQGGSAESDWKKPALSTRCQGNDNQPTEGLKIEREGKPMTPAEQIKVKDILAASQNPADLDKLTTLATTKGGFVDDEVRRVACTLSNDPLLGMVS